MRLETQEETIVRLEAIRQAHLNPDKEAWRRGNEHEQLPDVPVAQHDLASVSIDGQIIQVELKPKTFTNVKGWYGQLRTGKLQIKVEVLELD